MTTTLGLADKTKREIGQVLRCPTCTLRIKSNRSHKHFVFGFHGHKLSDEIRTLIRDYHLGCVILMKRNVRGTRKCGPIINVVTDHYADVQQLCRLIRELQQLAMESGHDKPLLIGTDQENGKGTLYDVKQ